MTLPSNSATRRILIIKADRLCANILKQTALRVFPAASFRTESSRVGALNALEAEHADLLLTGVGLMDGDTLELLQAKASARRFTRALVVTGRREHRILATLRGLPIEGVFDPTSEGLEQLEEAIRLVATGVRYWSPEVLACLHEQTQPADSICRLLSPTEHLVFAVVGDGSDDKEAAGRLNLRPSTIHSVRRELHRKLGVRHKGELVRLAVMHGYVRFTNDGVHRPGFSNLLAACGKSEMSRQFACR
jgi:DNA-binding NarL/FixJ family response regulator